MDKKEERIWWKKVGGGSLRFKKKIIKPNERFQAYPHEIPAVFRDQIIPLDDVPLPAPTKKEVKEVTTKVEDKKRTYRLRVKGKDKDQYDVVYSIGTDKSGKNIWKAINEKPLTKDVARELIADLTR